MRAGYAVLNRAAQHLRQLPGSAQQKADRFTGGKVRTLYAYMSGAQAPRRGPARQEMADNGGPDPSWWDEPVAGPPAAAMAPEGAAPPATPEAVADEADALLGDVQRARAAIAQAQGGDPSDVLRDLERCASMLATLQKLRGVLMSPRQLLASPHWRRIEGALKDALAPYPDALAAVCEALLALDGEPE